ncbi:MAG: hypothetical protein NZM03_12520, partial [Limisphaera sp.]|nr:hypothetical protein [Limisphaera sp.]
MVAPQAVANIDRLSGDSGYQVSFYNVMALTSQRDETGRYVLQNPEQHRIVTWTVDYPDGPAVTNRIRVREQRPGAADRVWMYTWEEQAGLWRLLEPDGRTERRVWQRWHHAPDGSLLRTLMLQSGLAGGETNFQMQRIYQHFPWGEGLIQEIIGSGSEAQTNRYSYYDTNEVVYTPSMHLPPLRRVERADGSWVEYDSYDAQGRPLRIRSTWLDTSPLSNPGLVRVVEYSYEPVAAGDDGSFALRSPRTVIERVGSAEIARTYALYAPTGSVTLRVAVPGLTYSEALANAGTERTVTVRDPISGRILATHHPDGTVSLFERIETNGWVVTVTSTGQPDHPQNPTSIIRGQRAIRVKGSHGETVLEQTYSVEAGLTWLVDQRSYSDFDAFHRARRITYLDDSYETFSYDCCGLHAETDRDGVTTVHLYDALRRRVGFQRNGITWSNLLDAAGQVRVRYRVGRDGSRHVLEANLYDTAGRLVRQTNALGGVTVYFYTNTPQGGREIRITYPHQATRLESYYRDGRLKSVRGTGALWESYVYGVSQGSLWKRTIRGDFGSPEWSTEWTDMLGRSIRTQYPEGEEWRMYDAAGRLVRSVDADGVQWLYVYGADGQLERTVLDFDRNGRIDLDGSDRMSRRAQTVAQEQGRVWQIHRQWEWDGTQEIMVSEERVSNSFPETRVSVQNNRTTTTVTTRLPAQRQRLVTITYPDHSLMEQLYTNGLLARVRLWSNTNRNTLLQVVHYGYDAHDRQTQVIDGRNGLTTHSYNEADLRVQTIQPDPDGPGPLSTGVTTWQYDPSLRVTNVSYPGGRWERTVYNAVGQIHRTWGSTGWPTEYAYDHAGRLTNLVTWQQFNLNTGQGVSGVSHTAWFYDANGRLRSKWYADPNTGLPAPSRAVLYAWSPGGRLISRQWARGVVTSYVYNQAGDLVKVHYSDGTLGYTNHYDPRGRIREVVHGPATLRRWYTPAGELHSEAWIGGPLDGVRVTNILDQAGRLRTREVWQGSNRLSRVDYMWDGANRLLSVADELGNRADYEWETLAPLVRRINFQSSGTGRMSTIRSFDLWNRLTNVQSSVATGLVSRLSWTYDTRGQRVRALTADGSYWLYRYDAFGQLESGRRYWGDGRPVAGQQYEYRHDAIGNRTLSGWGGDERGQSLHWSTFTVNRLNQYTSRTVPPVVAASGVAAETATVTLWWDTNAWTSVIRQGRLWYGEVPVQNSTGAVWVVITNVGVVRGQPDRVQTEVRRAFVSPSPETLVYDLDGNLVQDGRWRYRWDAENRLVGVESMSLTPRASWRRVEWQYDGLGRRVRQITADGSSGTWQVTEDLKWVSDPMLFGRHIAELNATNNALVRSYVWGLDLSGTLDGAGGVGGLLWVTQHSTPQAATHFAAYDGNGNVAALVQAQDGTESARYEYGPFGEPLRATGPLAKENPFRFSTKRTDPTTDLVLYEYRPYSPGLGRWPSRDPIGELGGKNLYAYVAN